MFLNCKGRLLNLTDPVVMGILNATPDSFFQGSRVQTIGKALRTAEKMVIEGASILDIGGASSRPGAEMPSEAEELDRVLPIIQKVSAEFPNVLISVDTWRGKVAAEAVAAGAHIINDISAGTMDESLWPTVAELGVPYVLMHIKGNPKSMQQNPEYQDVTLEILDFFIKKTIQLSKLGIYDLVLDPGFGFGKTLGQNYELMRNLHAFSVLPYPMLVGVSRKSMIYNLLNTSPEKALNGTSVLHLFALQQGARILRAHDVREAVECILLHQRLSAPSVNI